MIRALLFAVAVSTSVTTLAHATDFPTKPIRIINPTAAGSGIDTIVRYIGEQMQADWGHPGILENYGGAGGIQGYQLAATAAPDGYTILAANVGPSSILPNLKKDLPYSDKDFIPLVPLLTQPNILVVPQKSEIKTVDDLIAYAKKNPQMTFATNGVGQSPHLAAELLKITKGIDFKIVPYKGTAPALADVMGGHVDAMFGNTGVALPLVESGQLRAIAVTSAERHPSLPNVPTMIEAGVKDFQVTVWVGMLARAGTPPDVIDKLNAEFTKILATQKAKDLFKSVGVTPFPGTPAQFGEFIQTERAKWGDVIKKANIVIE